MIETYDRRAQEAIHRRTVTFLKRRKGRLIIIDDCTHKKIVQLSPCVIDVDKAVPVWNKLFPDSIINTMDPEAILTTSRQEETKEVRSFSLLSGAAYGSSFVGMVHILRQETNPNSLSLLAVAKGLNERLTVGKWLAESSGGFGVGRSFAAEIKNLLSTQQITAHVTVVVMGALPSIKSRELKNGIKGLTDFGFNKITAGLSSINNATSSDKKTVELSAETAKTGSQVTAMQGAVIQNLLSGLKTIDQDTNKVMDINSLMLAFENYLEDVKKGDSGVPIRFYLKHITQQHLSRLWLNKYYPQKESTN